MWWSKQREGPGNSVLSQIWLNRPDGSPEDGTLRRKVAPQHPKLEPQLLSTLGNLLSDKRTDIAESYKEWVTGI